MTVITATTHLTAYPCQHGWREWSPSEKLESDMTNLDVEIDELTMDELNEVSGGEGDGTHTGGGGGKGTGGGRKHWWAGGDNGAAVANIA